MTQLTLNKVTIIFFHNISTQQFIHQKAPL